MNQMSNTEITILIDEWVHNLLYRDILKDRLCNGLTYEKLAEKYDMSVRGVKRIVDVCTKQILEHTNL